MGLANILRGDTGQVPWGPLESICCFGSLHSSVPGSVGRVYFFILLYLLFWLRPCTCTSNSFCPSSQSIKSDCSVDNPAQSSRSPPGPDLLASLANESDLWAALSLTLKTSVNSDKVAELMLFQDRLQIGDRRQRRHQALHPVIWLAMAASEVDIWTASIITGSRVYIHVASLVCTFACTII